MFIHYNANPLYKDTDDCTVRAISLFTGKSYDETFIGIVVTRSEFNELIDVIKGLKASVDEWSK